MTTMMSHAQRCNLRTFRVYRNLHKQNWTIQTRVNGRWVKVDEADTLRSARVLFRVFNSGRERARNERKKNVHAFAYLDDWSRTDEPAHWERAWDRVDVTYNPYDDKGFRSQFTDNISEGRVAAFLSDGKIACAITEVRRCDGCHVAN